MGDSWVMGLYPHVVINISPTDKFEFQRNDLVLNNRLLQSEATPKDIDSFLFVASYLSTSLSFCDAAWIIPHQDDNIMIFVPQIHHGHEPNTAFSFMCYPALGVLLYQH